MYIVHKSYITYIYCTYIRYIFAYNLFIYIYMYIWQTPFILRLIIWRIPQHIENTVQPRDSFTSRLPWPLSRICRPWSRNKSSAPLLKRRFFWQKIGKIGCIMVPSRYLEHLRLGFSYGFITGLACFIVWLHFRCSNSSPAAVYGKNHTKSQGRISCQWSHLGSGLPLGTMQS